MYTSEECTQFVNPQAIVDAFMKNQGFSTWEFNIFKKKYGGIYHALLESQKGDFEFLIRPSSVFSALGDYEEMDMFGMNFDHDFDSVLEFIHISFDVTKQNQLFAEFQENSKYFIWLFYEEEEGISEIRNSLRNVGFHVGTQSDNFLRKFLSHLGALPAEEKLPLFQREFNANVENINKAIEVDGAFIYYMGGVSDAEFSRLNQKIDQLIDKWSCALLVHCGPPIKLNKYAPYTIPIFIALNFSDSTRQLEIDSIAFFDGRNITLENNGRATPSKPRNK